MYKYWIKLYHEILDDPKIGRLSDRTWRRAIELLLLAGDSGDDGALPTFPDIAWRLRLSDDELHKDIVRLIRIGLITQNDDGDLRVVDFEKTQAPSEQTIKSHASHAWYQEYLQSDHWQKTRKETLEYAQHTCQKCKSPNRLEVHHTSYERLGHERQSDLMALCHDCHREEHNQ